MKSILRYLRKVIPHNSPLRLWYTRVLQYYTYKTDALDLSDMKLIAVTGTDGKTTTVEMIAHILDDRSVPYLSSTSLESKINGTKLGASKRTTPSLRTLHTLLREAKDSGVKVAVIEVSSHALVQWRVLGIRFDVVVLTNITHEHLNFHKTRDNYAEAKKLLFTKHLKRCGTAILPETDDYGAQWIQEFGTLARAYNPQALGAITDRYGTAFIYDNTQYQIPMLGAYNAGNALAASLAVNSALRDTDTNISVNDALDSMRTFSGVPGRMQVVTVGNPHKDVLTIVDFALTENAMTHALQTVREAVHNGRVIVVFGASGGQHDATVHPGLAKAAAEGADVCIVTDDEPYDGNPDEIRSNLIKNIEKVIKLGSPATKCEYHYNIADRREAIRKAIELANDGDAIIVTGMGHYTSRTVNGVEVPWNDAEALREELNNFNL